MTTRNFRVERRIDRRITVLQIAAVTCALFAAAGIAHGLHLLNPEGGWLFPAGGGIAAAVGIALVWHTLIGSVIGTLSLTQTILRSIGAVALTVIVLMGSAQSIATALAGKASLAAELATQVDPFSKALTTSYGEAMRVTSIFDAATTKAAGFKAQRDAEEAGGNGSGKGCGPRCVSLRDAAASFTNAGVALGSMIEQAQALRAQGEKGLGAMREAAATSNQTAFMAAVQDVGQAIAGLNAIDPRAVVASTGMVNVAGKGGFDLTSETKDFVNVAEKALAERVSVETPAFAPLSIGEATRRQMFGAALHGWVLASAIDIVPLFAFLFALSLSRETYMMEQVEREVETAESRAKDQRDKVDEMLGRKPTLVPFKQPAE